MKKFDINNENQLLRRKLKTFLSQARENELKMRRFDQLVLDTIQAGNLSKLLHSITHRYIEEYPLDEITVTLIDTDFQYRNILADENEKIANDRIIVLDDEEALIDLLPKNGMPFIGKLHHKKHKLLFPNKGRKTSSVALLPLVHRDKIIGSYNLRSNDTMRFPEDGASDFLQKLAAIIAVSIENARLFSQIQHQSTTDPLTSLKNRRYFDQEFLACLSQATKQRTSNAILLMDIDKFKNVNDTYGHAAGDIVLRETARIIKTTLPTGSVCARYGGEEFCALLPNTNKRQAEKVAKDIRRNIENYVFQASSNKKLKVTISIGVNSISHIKKGAALVGVSRSVIENADKALYEAKETGRNRVVTYRATNNSLGSK